MPRLFHLLFLINIFFIFFGKALYNISFVPLFILSLCYAFTFKKQVLEFFLKNKPFFLCVASFFIIYNLVNLFHLGLSNEFLYSIKRTRWCIYALVLLPCIKISFDPIKDYSFQRKIISLFFYLSSLLFLIIFTDSILKVFYENPILSPERFMNVASWFYNPIAFSKITVFAAFLMLLFSRFMVHSYKKALAGFQVFMLIALTLLTQTRATWLGLILITFLFILVQLLYKRRKLAFMTLTLYVFIFGGLTLSQSFREGLRSSFSTDSYFSNVYRLEHWKANLKLIADNPLLGVGNFQNTKESIISPYLNEAKLRYYTNDKKLIYKHAHNELLDLASAGGLVSLLPFILCLVLPLLKLSKIALSFNSNIHWVHSMAFYYLVFLYFSSAFFDKISYTDWALVLVCWSIAFIAPKNLPEDLRVS